MTADEKQRLFDTCSKRAPSGVRDRALMGVMRYCGLRIGEALALRVRDYDAKAGTLRVRKGKTKLAQRVLGVPPVLVPWLDRWLEVRRDLGAKRAPMFCLITDGKVGDPLSDNAVRKMVKRRGERTGIERRVHPHALRHGCAFELAAQNVPMHVIQRVLGHSSLATTSRYLGHVGDAEVIRTMQGPPLASGTT